LAPISNLSADSIPDNRARETKDVLNQGCDGDEHNGRSEIERSNHVDWLDHVRPENEVDDRLCPTDQHQERPN
jgi:hypothetical protein